MLVDDQSSFRIGMTELIESEPGLRVVAEAGDGCHALEVYRQIRPDVVLMDLHMPRMGGVEAILALCSGFPDARVIVLTTFSMNANILLAIQPWAKAYLLKCTPPDEIAWTIRAVHAGKQLLPRKLAERLTARKHCADFSERELAALKLLTKDRNDKEIGTALFIKDTSVKNPLATLFYTFRVKDRTTAAIRAIRHALAPHE